jgi:hypothetical protein
MSKNYILGLIVVIFLSGVLFGFAITPRVTIVRGMDITKIVMPDASYYPDNPCHRWTSGQPCITPTPNITYILNTGSMCVLASTPEQIAPTFTKRTPKHNDNTPPPVATSTPEPTITQQPTDPPTPTNTPEPDDDNHKCNAGRGNGSEPDKDNDCDPGNSGEHNNGGD